MSYKSFLTNLKKHIDRKHPMVREISRHEGNRSDPSLITETGESIGIGVGVACEGSSGCANGDDNTIATGTNISSNICINNVRKLHNTGAPGRKTFGHRAMFTCPGVVAMSKKY